MLVLSTPSRPAADDVLLSAVEYTYFRPSSFSVTTHALRPALVDAAPMRAGFFDRPARKPPGRAAASTEAPAAPVPAHASLDELVKRGWRFGHACVNDDLAEGATNVLLLLHGRGDAPETFARLAKSLNLPRTACVALAGTRALPFDLPGREWFPREDLITAEPIDWRLDADRRRADAVVDAARRVADLVDALAPRFPSERVHVFGFADGGVVALEVAASLRDRDRTVGGVAVARATRLPERLIADSSDSRSDSNPPPVSPRASRGVTSSFPVTIVVGEGDRAAAEATAAALGDDADVRVEPPGEGGGVVAERGNALSPWETRALMAHWGKTLVDAAPRSRAEDFGEGVREVLGGWAGTSVAREGV